MDPALFLQTLLNSVSQGTIYAVIALGLALGFGVMKMANFAHGEFYMLGAYTVFILYAKLSWAYPLAVLAAFPIVALLGVLTERLIFKPTRGNVLAGFMATAGLTLMLQVLVGQLWGVGLMRKVPSPYQGVVDIAGASIGYQRLVIIVVTPLIIGALWYFLNRVKIGKALRATAQDAEVAAMYGINIDRMAMLAMLVAGGLAGVAGALMAPIQAVTPYMGHFVILPAFIAVIVGGMGSIGGAVLAAFFIGIIEVFVATTMDGVAAKMAIVLLMVIILVFRPQGLLGRVRM